MAKPAIYEVRIGFESFFGTRSYCDALVARLGLDAPVVSYEQVTNPAVLKALAA